jgi:hypothetical protein
MKYTTNNKKPQLNSWRELIEPTKLSRPSFSLNAFVCDECCLPMRLYGENFIESYSRGRANTLKCLCDLHAAELMEVNS